MLAEIFVLRLEAILRSNALASTSSDIRFVPVKPSIGPGKGKLVQFFFLIPHKLHDGLFPHIRAA
jgi:hypothetical protein